MIDRRVGQLIWGFIRSRADVPAVELAASEGRLSGVWLLSPEMQDAASTTTLINALQSSSRYPLLVGVDAEAGMGLVMQTATELPGAMALGATRDPDLAGAAATVTAVEAAASGINAVAAPVLDVNINPGNPIINTRSFGADPHLVARLGAAYIKGFEQTPGAGGQVLPIAKHFPGHGDTTLDSHLHLDTVDVSRERLEAVELVPFRGAISTGVPMLMTAHVAYPALDTTGTPATLSYPILTELLQQQMHFRGAIVTDCMNMHSIAHNFDPSDAAVQAVLAGCDLVLTDEWDLTFEALMRAGVDGRLPESRLAEASNRVRAVKQAVFGPDLAPPQPIEPQRAQESVGVRAHVAVAERIAAASITMVTGSLPAQRPALLIGTRMGDRMGDYPDWETEPRLRAAIDMVGWSNARMHVIEPNPQSSDIDTVLDMVGSAEHVALLHFNRVQSFNPDAVLIRDELVRLVDRLAANGVPVTMVSMGTPYVLPRFDNATARLCSYSACDASIRAVLRVLMGQVDAPGRLPVSLGGGDVTPLPPQ